MSNAIQQTFTSIQRQATSDVLHLLDGFFENLENGLFELAYRLDDPSVQERCAATMKDLRVQKARMLRTFARLMEADQALWVSNLQEGDRDEALRVAARSLARKHANHFDAVLRSIARQIALATARDEVEVEIPIAPSRLAYHFLRCLGDTRDDPEVSSMLGDLFGRLVLDRLGPLYGSSNSRLQRAEGVAEQSGRVA